MDMDDANLYDTKRQVGDDMFVSSQFFTYFQFLTVTYKIITLIYLQH